MSVGDPTDDWIDGQHSADNKEEVDQHWESARFQLHVTEEHSLTHASVDSFCDSTQLFVEKICSQISKWIEDNCHQVLIHNIGMTSYKSVFQDSYLLG